MYTYLQSATVPMRNGSWRTSKQRVSVHSIGHSSVTLRKLSRPALQTGYPLMDKRTEKCTFKTLNSHSVRPSSSSPVISQQGTGMRAINRLPIGASQAVRDPFPWTSKMFLVGAPMRVLAGPELAVAVTCAGGVGFIGPTAKPADLEPALVKARSLLSKSQIEVRKNMLPIGVGFQIWDANLDVAIEAIRKHSPSAVWLFAPRDTTAEFGTWARKIRQASPETQIWVQIGTLQEAVEASELETEDGRPDVLVVQGTNAGGHGRAKDGSGLITLLPEVSDAFKSRGSNIPLIAAGGIADGRGVVSALGLGAVGVAMGTRFLASSEANISKGYQDAIVRATDGARSTVRTTLYNRLRGTIEWPEAFSPRTVVNQSYFDDEAGVEFDELKRRHDKALEFDGDRGWGPDGRLATYAGSCVGLVNDVKPAKNIMDDIRKQAYGLITDLSGRYS